MFNSFSFVRYVNRGEHGKMNKQLSKLICLVFLVSIITSQFPASIKAASYSAKVTADILNVRSKASTSSSVKFKLKQGTAVTVTAEKSGCNARC